MDVFFILWSLLYLTEMVNAKCKTMTFKPDDEFDHKTLQGHVFKTKWASDRKECRRRCFMDPSHRCISYNFESNKNKCELSDSDHVIHQRDLIGQEGTVYGRAKNSCSVCKPLEICNFVGDSYGSCTCKAGFTGAKCDVEIKPCDSSPCQNGGSCTNTQDTFKCTCPLLFTGRLCDTQIIRTACDSNPCQNGGVCTSDASSFKCTCASNYSGLTCETVINTACDSTPCRNSGVCTPDGNSFKCTCTSQYTGLTCDTAISSACETNPCLNGGVCTPDGSSFKCTCASKYTGLTCETVIDPCNPSPCPGQQCTRTGDNSYYCIGT